MAELLGAMRAGRCSPKTSASALGTLQGILRYARRHGWIRADPVELLETWERPRPRRRRQRVLGRGEIERLLGACPPRGRLLVTTALYSGLRISEMLGLTWGEVDFRRGVIAVRFQLSRARRGEPPRRAATKTPASVREVPLVPQLADLLAAHRQATPYAAPGDWVFVTGRGTLLGHRNVSRRVLQSAARAAGLDDEGWPPLRIHDLRHTFASHLIVDLELDVAQVSRILGHARITITLDTYTHLFDDARHLRDIRSRMAAALSPACWKAMLTNPEGGCFICASATRGTRPGKCLDWIRSGTRDRQALRTREVSTTNENSYLQVHLVVNQTAACKFEQAVR